MENKNTSEDLINFISNNLNIPTKKIHFETGIEMDLGIYGDEAVEFLVAYSEYFHVDLSQFHAEIYFSSEGLSIFSPIYSLLGWSKKKKELFVKDLYQGITKGKLK